MATSPTQRTKARLKKINATHQVVEKFMRAGPKKWRVDLFGVIDIVAMMPIDGVSRIVGIQATASGWQARKQKAESEPRLRDWLSAGGVFEVWGWREVSAKTKGGRLRKRKVWRPWIDRAEMTEGVIEWKEIER